MSMSPDDRSNARNSELNSNNENIFTQLLFNEDDYQENPEEIANRINEAFLQPMREYEPLSSNPFNNGEFGPDLETFELTELDTSCNLFKIINPQKAIEGVRWCPKLCVKRMPR